MNQQRRKLVLKYQTMLSNIQNYLQDVCNDEEQAFDGIAENLRESDRAQKIEENIDDLNNAIESIGEAIYYLDEAVS